MEDNFLQLIPAERFVRGETIRRTGIAPERPAMQYRPRIWSQDQQTRAVRTTTALQIRGETEMKSTFGKYSRLVVLLAAGMIAATGAAHADGWQDDEGKLAQMTELEQLHATFHAAISVHDPVNGDSPAVITGRIREILSLWAKDAQLTVVSTAATAGNYIGNGDPDDPTTCPPPSGDTSATGQQGTLCTFFKYVAGGLQAANKFVSLSPAYKTKYVPVKDDDGEWKSSVYFECHYFDVSLDAATGQPFWTAKSHINLDGEARKIDGRWLLTRVSSSAVGVPIP
jgi:hypothetical protein